RPAWYGHTKVVRSEDRAIRTRPGLLTAPAKAWIPGEKEWGVMEPPNDSPPLVQKIGATSIAEIEKLIEQLQETKNFLQSEADRIERETPRSINLTDTPLVPARFTFITLPARP